MDGQRLGGVNDQRQSKAIRGNQWSGSALAGSIIRGNQWQSRAAQSEVIRCNQWQLGGNQWTDSALAGSTINEGNWRQLEAIGGNQEAIRANQSQSEPI